MADNIKTARGDDQYMLRLPAGMRDEIKASADANGRSMNAEIVSRLVGQQSLRDRFAGQCVGAALGLIERAPMAQYKSMATKRGLNVEKGVMSQLAAIMSYEIADAMIAARKAGA